MDIDAEYNIRQITIETRASSAEFEFNKLITIRK